jgi:hypothetical protein
VPILADRGLYIGSERRSTVGGGPSHLRNRGRCLGLRPEEPMRCGVGTSSATRRHGSVR